MEAGSSNANETKNEPITITAPPAGSVTIDPQNPLPEANFLWRRVITIFTVAVLLGLDWYIAVQIHDLRGASDNLLTLAKWNIVLNAAVLTYYFVAPSAAELTNMIQSASIIKHGMASAAQTAIAASENLAGAPKQPLVAPDSQIPPAPLYEPPSPPSGDLPDSGEDDAAPKGRS